MTAIGQNFNLGPSGGLNGGSYGDHTGLMGFPPLNSDAGAMCYNAAKSYQLVSFLFSSKFVSISSFLTF